MLQQRAFFVNQARRGCTKEKWCSRPKVSWVLVGSDSAQKVMKREYVMKVRGFIWKDERQDSSQRNLNQRKITLYVHLVLGCSFTSPGWTWTWTWSKRHITKAWWEEGTQRSHDPCWSWWWRKSGEDSEQEGKIGKTRHCFLSCYGKWWRRQGRMWLQCILMSVTASLPVHQFSPFS